MTIELSAGDSITVTWLVTVDGAGQFTHTETNTVINKIEVDTDVGYSGSNRAILRSAVWERGQLVKSELAVAPNIHGYRISDLTRWSGGCSFRVTCWNSKGLHIPKFEFTADELDQGEDYVRMMVEWKMRDMGIDLDVPF